MATEILYQWFSNSRTVHGQTNSRFVFNPVNRYDNGTYTCKVIITSPLLNSNVLKQNMTTLSVSGDIIMKIMTRLTVYLFILVPLPSQPSLSVASRSSRPITLSWTQPSSGGFVDSYTVQYSARVRNCDQQSSFGPIPFNASQRSYRISGLEEDSTVTGTLTAINIRGRTERGFSTTTITAGNSLHYPIN